jgi:hypothetical protein
MLLGRYIPEDSNLVEFQDVKLQVYTYTNINNKLCAIAYTGKSKKHLWCYSFENEEKRGAKINETVSSLKASLQWKEERKREKDQRKKDLVENIKAGDIFYDTWGYEQTNVTFMQVTFKKGSTVKLKEIASELVEDTGMNQGYKMPCQDCFLVGKNYKEITKRILSDRIKIDDVISLTKWDGKKVWSSWYY